MSSGKTFKASSAPSLALLLNPLAWFLWILDFAIWVLTFGWVKTLKFYLQPSYSVEVGPAVCRNRAAVDKLFTSPVPEGEGGGAVLTTPKLFAWAAAKYGDEKAMGTRTYSGEYKEQGWRFPKKKFGATTLMVVPRAQDEGRRVCGRARRDESQGRLWHAARAAGQERRGFDRDRTPSCCLRTRVRIG